MIQSFGRVKTKKQIVLCHFICGFELSNVYLVPIWIQIPWFTYKTNGKNFAHDVPGYGMVNQN